MHSMVECHAAQSKKIYIKLISILFAFIFNELSSCGVLSFLEFQPKSCIELIKEYMFY